MTWVVSIVSHLGWARAFKFNRAIFPFFKRLQPWSPRPRSCDTKGHHWDLFKLAQKLR